MNRTSLLLPGDHEAVIHLLESYLRSWNAQDTGGLLSYFSEHAEFSGATGDVATGKPAIRTLFGYYFDMVPEGSDFGFTELYLRYLQKDMVIGTARWLFRSGDGPLVKVPVREGIMQIICSKTSPEAWEIILVHSLETATP